MAGLVGARRGDNACVIDAWNIDQLGSANDQKVASVSAESG